MIKHANHLLQLCRYIHSNPVKDGLVADPADWPYSNYLDWIGERNGNCLIGAFSVSNLQMAQTIKPLCSIICAAAHCRKMSNDI